MGYAVVARHAVGCTEFEIREPARTLQPRLLGHAPAQRHAGEPGGAVALGEERRDVGADRRGEEVLAVEAVAYAGEQRLQDLVGQAVGARTCGLAIVHRGQLVDGGGVQRVDVVRREARSGQRHVVAAGALRRIAGQNIQVVTAEGAVVVQRVLGQQVDEELAAERGLTGRAILQGILVGIGISGRVTQVEAVRGLELEPLADVDSQVEVARSGEAFSPAGRVLHDALGVVVRRVEGRALVPGGVAVLVGGTRRSHDVVEVAAAGETRVAGEGRRPGVVPHGQERRSTVEVDEVVARTGALLIVGRHVHAELDRLREVGIQLRAEGHLLHLVLEHDALIAGPRRGRVVADVLLAARHRELHVGDAGRIAQALALPVRSAHVRLDPCSSTILRLHGGTSYRLLKLLQLEVLRRGEQIVQLIGPLDALIELDRVFRLVGRTALGSYHDNAVGGTRTVDGGRGGVLQNFDRFDVGGVDVGQRQRAGESVDHHQRLAVGRDRAGAAHADRGGDTHLRGGIVDLKTGDLALQGGRQVRCGTVGDGVAVEFRNRTREVRFHLGTVTDHDHLVQRGGFGFHRDTDFGLRADRDLLGAITHEGEDQYGIVIRNRQFERSVQTGGNARRGGVAQHDGDTHHGAFAIGDHSSYRTLLSQRRGRSRQNHDCDDQRFEK